MRRIVLGLTLVLVAAGCATRGSGPPVFSPDGKYVARIDQRFYKSRTRDLWSYVSELLPIEVGIEWFPVDAPDKVRSLQMDKGGPNEYVIGSPLFSPDSRYLAMVPTRHLRMIELASGKVREILPNGKGVDFLAWVDDDRIVYTASEIRGKVHRRTVERRKISDNIGEAEVLYDDERTDGQWAGFLYLSPNARHVLCISADGKGRIRLVDLYRRTVRDVGAAWTREPSTNFDCVEWKPDSSAVFVYDHLEYVCLLVDVDSGEVRDLYPRLKERFGQFARPLFWGWTADGRYVLMTLSHPDSLALVDTWLLSPHPWIILPIGERFVKLIDAEPDYSPACRLDCIPGWIWMRGPDGWYMVDYEGTKSLAKSTFDEPNPAEEDLPAHLRQPAWFTISPDGRREIVAFPTEWDGGYEKLFFRDIRFPPPGIEKKPASKP